MLLDVLYNGVVLPLLRASVWAGQWWIPKLRERELEVRKGLPEITTSPSVPRALFHAASMGELEQLLPIIEILKQRLPEAYIITSCTSASGYNHARKQSLIDLPVYLPIDSRGRMKKFIRHLRPNVVVIDRYDVWPNFVSEASKRCPVFLVNATFPSLGDRPLLTKWIASYYKKLQTIIAVAPDDARRLSQLVGRDIDVEPDTRIDRVKQRLNSADTTLDVLRRPEVCTLILGSSWEPDEDLILNSIDQLPIQGLRLIIVPHEPTEHALGRIERRIACTRLSASHESTKGHIVVDSVGKLLSLYRIADAAFVGGGFGAGVHSTTEPAVYGIPVACGPHIGRSRDTQALVTAGVVTVLSNPNDVQTWLAETVNDAEKREHLRRYSSEYFAHHSGSADRYTHIIAHSLSMHNKHL